MEGYSEDERWSCLFGEACLCPHWPHTQDECFTLEMAEAYEQEWREQSGEV